MPCFVLVLLVVVKMPLVQGAGRCLGCSSMENVGVDRVVKAHSINMELQILKSVFKNWLTLSHHVTRAKTWNVWEHKALTMSID